MHPYRKPTLWHLIICYFHSSGMICRKVIQTESSSSNPDVGRVSPTSLRSGNHRKSLEVLVLNLHVKAHVKTSNKSTARGTNAPHFLGICGSCWFQQDGATVHTTIRARNWLKRRFGGGGEGISRLTKHPWPGPDLSPLDLVLERSNDSWKEDPHHACWAERNHRVLRLSSQWTKKKSNRRYGVSADELAPTWNVTVPRLRRDSSGPDSVVHCRPLTVFCALKLKQ